MNNQTNDAYNLPLLHTSDDYSSPSLHTDNAYDSFTDTYLSDIMASEDILDDFDNEVDFKDEDEEAEPEPRYSLTMNQKNDNQIRISNIIETHNYEMAQNITMVEAKYRIDENLACQENCCSICSQERPNSCICNSDVSNNRMDYINKEGFSNVVNYSHNENKSRHCGICGQIGHNAHTCNLDSSSNRINYLGLEGHNCENEIRSPLPLPIANKNGGDLNLISLVNKDLANNKSHCCGTCGQVGHNAC
ncbi:14881_t:CDS:2, partial [Gigaspora margarita]